MWLKNLEGMKEVQRPVFEVSADVLITDCAIRDGVLNNGNASSQRCMNCTVQESIN
jgi:hypothetical protein